MEHLVLVLTTVVCSVCTYIIVEQWERCECYQRIFDRIEQLDVKLSQELLCLKKTKAKRSEHIRNNSDVETEPEVVELYTLPFSVSHYLRTDVSKFATTNRFVILLKNDETNVQRKLEVAQLRMRPMPAVYPTTYPPFPVHVSESLSRYYETNVCLDEWSSIYLTYDAVYVSVYAFVMKYAERKQTVLSETEMAHPELDEGRVYRLNVNNRDLEFLRCTYPCPTNDPIVVPCVNEYETIDRWESLLS